MYPSFGDGEHDIVAILSVLGLCTRVAAVDRGFKDIFCECGQLRPEEMGRATRGATVHVSGDDGSAVAAAKAELDALNELPVIAIAIARGSAERIVRDGAHTVQQLRERDDIVAIEISDSVVSVIAESSVAAMTAVRVLHELTLPSKSHMKVPQEEREFIVGEGNVTIDRICSESGCVAEETAPGHWTIEGPNPLAVKKFIDLSTAVVRGISGSVDQAGIIHRVVDRALPAFIDVAGTDVPNRDPTKSLAERLVESVAHEPLPQQPINVIPTTELRSDGEGIEQAQASPPHGDGSHDRRRPAGSGESAPSRPRHRDRIQPLQKPARSHRRAIRITALAGVAAMVVAGAMVLPGPSGPTEVAGPIGAIPASLPPSAEPPVEATAEPMTFALGNAQGDGESCWLGVMGTWSEQSGARAGVDRLHAVGLPAATLDSAHVPGWSSGRFVAAVATREEAAGRAAIERARTACFEGSMLGADAGACDNLYAVPPGSPIWLDDVAPGDASHDAIRWAIDNGATTACSGDPNRFCPDGEVTRGDLAMVLTAPFGIDPTGTSTFRDVSSASLTAAAHAVLEAELMTVCDEGANQFCPDQRASRGEAALALATALALGAQDRPHFTDASPAHGDAATALHDTGVVDGCGATHAATFCPDEAITRATLAVWLHRAFENRESCSSSGYRTMPPRRWWA
ncbi:MAG TPA: hypothetical protein VLG28_08050 [Acidimicrobiia bacterium]|nr:hypothetical protein [Acidimicrobiia bacterium]